MGEYVRITLKQIREQVKENHISEEELRIYCYKNNPQYPKPDDGIEKIIQRIYHPTSSDLEEEELLGL